MYKQLSFNRFDVLKKEFVCKYALQSSQHFTIGTCYNK